MADIADIVIRVDSTQVTGASNNLATLKNNTVGLLASLSRAGAATLQYKRETALLNDAHRQHILNNSELTRSLRQLESRYNSMGLAVDAAGNLMENAQGRANQFGYRVQQVGYQVGDFFVQIQSGTNFMVAFGQQATQLAGLLPGVLGAALGIGISLFTAIGATLMRSSESAGTFQDALGKANDTLSETEDILKIVNGDFEALIEKFGRLSPAVMALAETRADISLRNMSDAAKGLRDELTEMYNGNAWSNTSRAEELSAAFNLNTQSSRELTAAMENLKNQDTLQGQVESATALRELFLSMAGPVEKMTSDELAFYLAIVDSEEAFRSLYDKTVQVQTTTSSLVDVMFLFVDAANSASVAVSNIGTQASSALNMVKGLAGAMWDAAQARISANKNLETLKMELSPGGQALMKYGGRGTVSNTPISGAGIGIPETGSGGGGGRSSRLKEEISLTVKLTEAEKERQSVVETVNGTLEDGFLDMVKGTKTVGEAFRSMAAAIIEELFRVLVVQKLVAGITSVFTGGGAGGFTNAQASRLTGGGRASGGSMMSGSSYLVGENGPELVIPRHSGTVLNANQTSGAMAGSGGFTQNLSINVSGSDAAMVRQEVAKMIPQITNATKAAVIDAKQRGGAMAAAFR
jgi:hypothetical protein